MELFIINNVTKSQFIKAILASSGLGWTLFAVTVLGLAFDALSRYVSGMNLYLKENYAYDPYEGFGKWNLVDLNYSFW